MNRCTAAEHINYSIWIFLYAVSGEALIPQGWRESFAPNSALEASLQDSAGPVPDLPSFPHFQQSWGLKESPVNKSIHGWSGAPWVTSVSCISKWGSRDLSRAAQGQRSPLIGDQPCVLSHRDVIVGRHQHSQNWLGLAARVTSTWTFSLRPLLRVMLAHSAT